MPRPARLAITKTTEAMTVDRAREWLESLTDDEAKALAQVAIDRDVVTRAVNRYVDQYLRSKRKGIRKMVNDRIDRWLRSVGGADELFVCPHCRFVVREWTMTHGHVEYLCTSPWCKRHNPGPSKFIPGVGSVIAEPQAYSSGSSTLSPMTATFR